MRVEEAIQRLETHKEYISPHGRFTKEAIDMAIEVLEKQIPKEFTTQHSVFDGAGKYLGRDYCPECDYALNYPEEFCPNCGQRILWDS